jgi:retron-type reverse transcriptase
VSNKPQKPSSLLEVKTLEELAVILELPLGQLRFHIRNIPHYYKEFKLTKRTGGVRIIHAPAKPLLLIQRRLARLLSILYRPRESARGFVPKQSVLTNASPHSGKRLILNLDLKDFFPSIHRGRVAGALKAHPFSLPKDVAQTIAELCCYNGALPQGAPTSPVISNIICWSLDRDLEHLAKQCYAYYTRYADDLTFSTNARSLPSALWAVGTGTSTLGIELRKVIVRNGFQVNEKKTRLTGKTGRQEVTGLTVNRFPNVRRRFIRQIRAMLHAWRKHKLVLAQDEFEKKYWRAKQLGKKPPEYQRVVLGKLNFLRQIRSEGSPIYRRLIEQYAQLDPNFALPPKSATEKSITELSTECVWVLESEVDGKESQGTGFLLKGVGLVTCQHVLSPGMKAFRSDHSLLSKTYDIEILYQDEILDLAVVRLIGVDESKFPALDKGNPKPLKQLDDLYACGFPSYGYGDLITIRHCQVASIGKRFGVPRIMLNTGIIKGMSGGPVMLPNGQVVGIAITGSDHAGDVDVGGPKAQDNGAISIDALEKLVNKNVPLPNT